MERERERERETTEGGTVSLNSHMQTIVHCSAMVLPPGSKLMLNHHTEHLKKVFPCRLRDPATGRGGEFTQPWNSLFDRLLCIQ